MKYKLVKVFNESNQELFSYFYEALCLDAETIRLLSDDEYREYSNNKHREIEAFWKRTTEEFMRKNFHSSYPAKKRVIKGFI